MGLLRGGDSGEPAIIPGKSEQSHLMQLVRGREAGKQMPPDEAERLTDVQLQLLATWIDQGALWPGSEAEVADEPEPSRHWSFQPLKPIPVPEVSPTVRSTTRPDWPANAIDRFVLQGLAKKSLAPNPSGSRAELIRRIYLDMLGVPPTPDEVHAFATDQQPRAVERLIERVLENPQYGERWARYWLDLVRFAETNGFETNRERPNAWPYRDYVIRSLNDDKPYDS
jgi:hypothetical protein